MRRTWATVIAGVAVFGLAGCYAQSEPATMVGSASATLNAHGFTGGSSAQAFFQYAVAKGALGTGFGKQTPTLSFGPHLSGPFAADVSGLSPGTNYFFRVCGNDVGQQPGCNSDLEFTTTVPGSAVAFAPPLAATGTMPEPSSVLATGDFNGDGIPDLVVADTSPTKFDVLLGNADATFRETSTVNVGTQPFSVAVGDFNRDGKQDLVVGTIIQSGQPESVAVYPGQGDGTFGAPVLSPLTNPPLITRIVVGDFNHDSRPDIALLLMNSGRATPHSAAQVMLGNGNGTFQPADQTFAAQGGAGGAQAPTALWSSLVVGDFNHDGRPDLALSEQGCTVTATDCGVSVFLGNGNGTFASPQVYDAGANATGLVEGTFHGGSVLDLVASTTTSGLNVLNGIGDGTFHVGVTYASSDVPAHAADINGDGKLDLVASPGTGTDVWLGNGNGTLQSPNTVSSSCTVGASANFGPAGTVADFNGDGKPDIACSAGSDSETATAVLLNATPPPAASS
jgi:hypothetical protein